MRLLLSLFPLITASDKLIANSFNSETVSLKEAILKETEKMYHISHGLAEILLKQSGN